MSGLERQRYLGTGVSSGDVNGDGFSNVVISRSPTASEGSGLVMLGAPERRSFTFPPAADNPGVLELLGARD